MEEAEEEIEEADEEVELEEQITREKTVSEAESSALPSQLLTKNSKILQIKCDFEYFFCNNLCLGTV